MKQITINSKEITLIETAHVSAQSVLDVQTVIKTVQPDTICVELDEKRYDNMMNPDKFMAVKLLDVIKEKRIWLFVVNYILAGYQKKMASQTQSAVGLEMKTGIQLAQETNANLVLMDRDVQTTFKRVWRNLTLKEKFKLINLLIGALFDSSEISEAEIEQLKQHDQLTAALSQVSQQFPSIAKTLIHERDQYMAMKIKHAPGTKIVAIIGAAHSPGIQQALEQEIDITELEHISQPSIWSKLFSYAFPFLIALLIVSSIGFNQAGLQHLGVWLIYVSIASSLGALVCLAHPITILVAFLFAPLSTLSPVLSVGWFVGLSEAYFRAPTVSDFYAINDDSKSIKKVLKNNILRTLCIMLVASLFSTAVTLFFSIDAIAQFFF